MEILEWTASISGILAAVMVASNVGLRVSGWGFILFTLSSICWIAAALFERESALAVQNVVLFGINLLGVYRYLIAKRPSD